MSFRFLLIAGACVLLATCQSVPARYVDETAAIIAVLDAQNDAWNRGDIPGFMDTYWKSVDLRFASGGSITYGWQATLDRYIARYGDDGQMGTLDTSDLIVEQTGSDDALVFGRWTLYRENDQPTGLFTLHLKKINGKWLIVSDHTSAAD